MCEYQHVNLIEDPRLSKQCIYGAFSERIHFYEYLDNTYISWQLFNVKYSTAYTEHEGTSLYFSPGYTHARWINMHCWKNGRQHFCFKLVNLYLLFEIRNRVWRDCNKSMFLSENFPALRYRNVSPLLFAPNNVANYSARGDAISSFRDLGNILNFMIYYYRGNCR